MNYTRFLNPVSLARKPGAIRDITALLLKTSKPIISMAAGRPNSKLFPFKNVSFTLRDGSVMELNEKETEVALQYGASQGMAELLAWLEALQKYVHNPPTMSLGTDHPSWLNLLITNGSQDGLCKAIESLVHPGDNLLVESPTYTGTISLIKPQGCTILPVTCDSDGMIPDNLLGILQRWDAADASNPKSSMPKLLYSVPNGGNPSGHTLSLERKQRIYQMAQKYDLLILEDDPYYFLQYNQPYVPSYLTIDTDGRVLRFDSFSKLVSSGLRLGYVSGPQAVIERLMLHTQVSCMHASGLSQASLLGCLKRWGIEGFLDHARNVASFYKEQCCICLETVNRHLTGLAEWNSPQSGMFLWLKLHGIQDTHTLIMKKALEAGVMFVPGI